jgi:fused signal recognition particle receptor
MAESKGFFRRIFSFARPVEPEPERPPEPAVAPPPAPTPPEPPAEATPVPAPPPFEACVEPAPAPEPLRVSPYADPNPVAADLASAEPPRAPEPLIGPAPDQFRSNAEAEDRPEPEPEPIAAPLPDADELPAPHVEAEPAEARLAEPEPEPEPAPAPAVEDLPLQPEEAESGDFSWLDAELPPEDAPEAETVIDAPVSDDTPLDAAIEAAIPDGPVEPDATLPELEAEFTAHDKDGDGEADFSWLDAELPPEDDEPAAPAVARAPLPAPIPDGSGFRLREDRAAPAPAQPARWIDRLRGGLARSSQALGDSIGSVFTKRRLDEDTLQDFEDVLIRADLGVETAMRITDRLSEGRFGREIATTEVRRILSEEVEKALRPVALPLELDLEKRPHVILVVGVNGTGKTTTIGKLTAKLTRAGLKVTLCAGDTFRAAAIEQLKIWGERTDSPVIAKAIGADAAGLAYEAYDAAVENGSDVLIIDTAGRLQNRTELMAELEKIVRVLQKREPDAPHTVLQTLDATTGQNALSQVEIFRNVAGVNGLVMTKLDGSARGGILVAIAAKHRLPVYFVGVGEGIDDLEPFDARDFAEAIAGTAPAPAA